VSGFSPLPMGDTSVGWRTRTDHSARNSVSVPFPWGTPLWDRSSVAGHSETKGFQSPSHGGHLCGVISSGTPTAFIVFQSPSHGGHLCGRFTPANHRSTFSRFSPLPMGDTSVGTALQVWSGHLQLVSVPFPWGTPLWGGFSPRPRCNPQRFSPLPMGDTSVGARNSPRRNSAITFQSPSHGGHLCGGAAVQFAHGVRKFQSPSHGGHLCGLVRNRIRLSRNLVSVPFPWGTPLWGYLECDEDEVIFSFSPLPMGDTSVGTPLNQAGRTVPMFQSPSHGGHLCGNASVEAAL